MKPIRSKNSPSRFFLGIAIAIILVISGFGATHSVAEERLPAFSLPSLFDSATQVTNRSLAGRVYLLNIWASWCGACQAEHSTMLMIAHKYHVPIYGIVYKDNRDDAKAWLQQAGNPFTVSAIDATGSLEYALSLYGTPETFLIDKKGIIRYRYAGTISQKDWETVLWPLIQQYNNT